MTTVSQHFDIDLYRTDQDARDRLEAARAIAFSVRKTRNFLRYARMLCRRDPMAFRGRPR